MELSKERVSLELRGQTLEEATDLNLDNTQCAGGTIEGVLDECRSLQALSLIGVGLNSLRGFPTLPNLVSLELAENRVNGGLNKIVTSCPQLAQLNLANNKLTKIEQLEPLKEAKQLRMLDLEGNALAGEEGYRAKVFELLPQLRYIDDMDKNGVAAPSEDEDDEEDEEDEEDDDNDDENDDEEDADDDEDDESDGAAAGDDDDDDSDSDSDNPGLAFLIKPQLDDEPEDKDASFEPGDDDEEEDEDFDEDDDEEDDDDDAGPSGPVTKRARTED
eukprot:m.483108 g.483108  ORF g.483108 m.483108 type:complete len:275 (+) comp22787_c0_seq1:288-1112(+)